MLDGLVILLVSWLVVNSNKRISRRYGDRLGGFLNRSWNYLFAYHLVFSCLVQLLPGDSIGYWNFGLQQIVIHSNNMFDYFGVGTVFLLFLDFIPVKVMGLSFFTGNILYGVVGFLGLRFLFILMFESLKVNVKILGLPALPYIFFLPNMNFWTAGVGKDTLCFFGIACFIYYFQKKRQTLVPWVLAFTLVYLIRPHVGMMILAGTAMGIVFSPKAKWYLRIGIPLLSMGAFALLYAQVAKFLKVDDLSVGSLSHVAADKAALLGSSGVGSSVDISNYSVPVRFLTYLYRPLFFEVHNLITLLSSVENLAYILITIAGFRAFRGRYLRTLPIWLISGFVVFLISMIVFANSLSNLGIIMRMKNMTMIYFLLMMVWFLSNRNGERLEEQAAVERAGTARPKIRVR